MSVPSSSVSEPPPPLIAYPPLAYPLHAAAQEMPPQGQYAHDRDRLIYELVVRQEPKQARMCGVGGKADRRPIDPPPIVQLRVIDPQTQQPAAPPSLSSSSSSIPSKDDEDKEETATAGGGNGYAQSFLQNPYYFMFASLAKPDDDAELHWLKDGRTRCTTGSVVSSLYHLKDPQHNNEDAGFFVFPDLSVRTEGSYRLKLSLFEVVGNNVRHCKSIYSAPFYVYTAKKFPGMEESTPLSCSLADQGIKIRIRKDIRVRKRPIQSLEHPISMPAENDSDEEDMHQRRPGRDAKRSRTDDGIELTTPGVAAQQVGQWPPPASIDPNVGPNIPPPVGATQIQAIPPPPGAAIIPPPPAAPPVIPPPSQDTSALTGPSVYDGRGGGMVYHPYDTPQQQPQAVTAPPPPAQVPQPQLPQQPGQQGPPPAYRDPSLAPQPQPPQQSQQLQQPQQPQQPPAMQPQTQGQQGYHPQHPMLPQHPPPPPHHPHMPPHGMPPHSVPPPQGYPPYPQQPGWGMPPHQPQPQPVHDPYYAGYHQPPMHYPQYPPPPPPARYDYPGMYSQPPPMAHPPQTSYPAYYDPHSQPPPHQPPPQAAGPPPPAHQQPPHQQMPHQQQPPQYAPAPAPAPAPVPTPATGSSSPAQPPVGAHQPPQAPPATTPGYGDYAAYQRAHTGSPRPYHPHSQPQTPYYPPPPPVHHPRHPGYPPPPPAYGYAYPQPGHEWGTQPSYGASTDAWSGYAQSQHQQHQQQSQQQQQQQQQQANVPPPQQSQNQSQAPTSGPPSSSGLVGAVSNANDRIQLAPLRASSGSAGSPVLPLTLPSGPGVTPNAGAQSGGGYHPVILLRSSSRNGYGSSQSRAEGGDRNAREGGRERERDADRKKNPLSIGSIISDDA